MSAQAKARPLFDPPIVRRAALESFKKLDPRHQIRNPVMFTVFIGSLLTTGLWLQAAFSKGEAPAWFIFAISAWLWFTVIFANFAEAMAEGRGKAQADSLRQSRRDVHAKKLAEAHYGAAHSTVNALSLRKGDVVLVEAGDQIPVDGEVIEGVASVDESAITGESAPVIRESGGDRSSVTGGTRVLSDWMVVRVAVNPGETFLDRMISLVEGAKRQKTPNEIALDILLAAMTIIFLLACVTLLPFSLYSVDSAIKSTEQAATANQQPSTAAPGIDAVAAKKTTAPGVAPRHVEAVAYHCHRVGRTPSVFDTDNDRRIAIGNWHRWHGSDDSSKRHRHVGPRGGSGR